METRSTRLSGGIIGFCAVVLLAPFASGQTLTEKLVAEDPVTLAKEARENGDIVRGAILFHQGNINCAQCHRPKAEEDRVGPDLSKLAGDITDAYLVESILQPSKEIKEGYETVVALNVDGQIVNGLLVEENSERIVIRESGSADKLIEIRREDLDEIRDGKKSSMPDNLANELKDRQQFLDLMRYVLEVRERGPQAMETNAKVATQVELAPEFQGQVLINESNCVACHQTESAFQNKLAKKPPDLRWSVEWLNPGYIEEFIAMPHSVKPGSTMPQVLRHLDVANGNAVAKALKAYLLSETKNRFQYQRINGDAIKRGNEMFHSVGCVACHNPRDNAAEETPLANSIPLGDLSKKYNLEGLVQFLEDPLSVRPSGRMPNMQLTHWEATDIASYLLQQTDEVEFLSLQRDEDLIRQGKRFFAELNCNSCHTEFDRGSDQPSFTAWNELDLDQGCLSDEVGAWPIYGFDENEKAMIRTAIQSDENNWGTDQQIAISLTSLNCTVCHDRDGLGGVTPDRNPHFQTTNFNLGDQGRIPPTLTGVGAKLKPKWMRDVLVNGRTVRPYMKTRMPQFGEKNTEYLVELFQEVDELSPVEFASFDDQKEMRQLGLELSGNKGLNCIACHTYKYKLSDTMPAADLTEMAERLKKDWFYHYMLAPQQFSPNTVMPSFWPRGVAIREDLPGDPSHQVEALWQYLIDGRQAGTPRGVVREPLEIVVTDEAQMLRRKYPGIGKRGIGVGYPGGVNIAFDAEQLRLAMIWKGRFADPAGVWTGQGSGNVRPMGKAINLPAGPELDDVENPWVVDEGRPTLHQFMGYTLDEMQRPTFNYMFEEVAILDFYRATKPEVDQPFQLARTVGFFVRDKDRMGLRFRIASAETIKKEDGNLFAIGSEFKVRVKSSQAPIILDRGDQQVLQINFDLKVEEEQRIELEYIWE